MVQYSLPIRVYIEDTDAGGIVYYANYLKYMERARAEWLRSRGVDLDMVRRCDNVQFVVRSVQIDYRSPAKYDDQLIAQADLLKIRRASVVCHQPIKRGETLLTDATVQLACVSADTLQLCVIPDQIREAMTIEQ
ncbi:MAG: tol-pal system-associated acyl-CoA thioesterase [Granulosicoccus sp.]|nr:tol-pal system-associated acyl-CoA thioesterase [Granulosicoccus sp.]